MPKTIIRKKMPERPDPGLAEERRAMEWLRKRKEKQMEDAADRKYRRILGLKKRKKGKLASPMKGD